MTGEPPVTGICGYNDEVALAVLAGMRGAAPDRAPGAADDILAVIRRETT